MMRLVRAVAPLLLLLPALAGCSGGSGAGFTVVASFYPLQYVAQRIAGGHADVDNLTPPGREPHDLELSVQQTAELSDADVVVYESGLAPAVDEAVANEDPEHAVDAARYADLEDHNPHFWLDPERLAAVATAVERQLAAADPDHRAAYEQNLRALRRELTALDGSYRKGLAHCRVTTVVVSHDAFRYWDKYGLSFAAIVGLSPDAEPSPARLAELEQLAHSTGVTTIFSETLVSASTARTLADETGLRTAVLDPIEGLTDETSDQDYLSLMRRDLAALQEAGGCT